MRTQLWLSVLFTFLLSGCVSAFVTADGSSRAHRTCTFRRHSSAFWVLCFAVVFASQHTRIAMAIKRCYCKRDISPICCTRRKKWNKIHRGVFLFFRFVGVKFVCSPRHTCSQKNEAQTINCKAICGRQKSRNRTSERKRNNCPNAVRCTCVAHDGLETDFGQCLFARSSHICVCALCMRTRSAQCALLYSMVASFLRVCVHIFV